MCGGGNCHVLKKLHMVQNFLEPFKCLANAHMNSFLTQNSWDILPPDIKNDSLPLSAQDMYEILWKWGSDPQKFHDDSSIGKFLKACWNASLMSDSFEDLFLPHGKLDESCGKALKCMSVKKTHEIGNLKEVVSALCEESTADCVIDLGGGKGYLGTSLVLEKKINVLSIDSKPTNTKGAINYYEKIEKSEGSPNNRPLYKQITTFVTSETDVCAIARNSFPSLQEYNICLTGLHVCGNLASTCVELFCKKKDIVSLCSIGCCYNLLTEEFDTEKQTEKSDDKINFGFPLSSFLKERSFVLGRNARMIACQSIDRICNEKRMMSPTIFWRAVLQVLLERMFGSNCELHVGRGCSKAANLSDYLSKAERFINRNLQLSKEVIDELIMETQQHYDKMVKFYCLRLALAPVVETLVVLDKLLYLHEQGMDNSYILKVFDGVKSPRCHAVVAMKIRRKNK